MPERSEALPASGQSSRRPWLANPEDAHCVVFHLVALAAHALAFWILLHPAAAGLDDRWSEAAFVAGAALMLGWVAGIDVGVNFHNHAHRRIFTRPLLNRWFGRIWTVTGGWPAYFWQYSHVVVHHRRLLTKDDWTLPRRRDDGRWEGFFRYCLLHWPWRYAWHLFQEFRPSHCGRAIHRRALRELAIFLALWSIPFWIDVRAALLLWVLPQYLANVLVLAPGMCAQHAGREDTRGFRHSNTFLSPVFNRTMFNIGFHAEHHTFPHVHWSRLPALHEELKNELVEDGAHVVPFGYFRGGLLLSRIACGDAAAHAEFHAQHPLYVHAPHRARPDES